MIKTTSFELDGKTMTVETGRLAKQASGSVLISQGGTVALVTAVASKEPREGIDFFPLTVDVEEKMYAAGRIPGGYIKREARPSEKAILPARLIDRPLRPTFPDGYHNDVQVIATVLSSDQENQADILMLNAASMAVALSNIPYDNPIAGVRVARVDGKLLFNPTHQEAEESDFDIIVAGTKDAILMVEAGVNIVPEEDVLEALLAGHDAVKKIAAWIAEFAKEAGKEKAAYETFAVDEELKALIEAEGSDKIWQALNTPGKHERIEALSAATDELKKDFKERFPEKAKDVSALVGSLRKKVVRKKIVEEGIRADGRALDEIRPITADTGILPRTHGTGLFTRGETQVLSIVTLGSGTDEQRLDGLLALEDRKSFMHHYNFPPFSTGEAYPLRGPKRREIGHGALAERAQVPVLPEPERFPYTIRIVSECLESNGSTSMASVCASNLALMDAGVPVKDAVAGVAMGLVKDGDKIAVLTDIMGMEDALGDMDFKVAGTEAGITALQMDMKTAGIDRDTLKDALERAKKGRLHILSKMREAITSPREELSEFAPKIVSIQIPVDKIGEVIGPKGKNIKGIIEDTGCQIDIKDDGTVNIASVSQEGIDQAVTIITRMTREVQPGDMYDATVVKIMEFGAFVELYPGKDGLLHRSQLGLAFGEPVDKVLKLGDVVKVKVREIDDRKRVNLVRVLEEVPAGQE